MSKIESVLAATDFSPDARFAVQRAAILAATLGWRRAGVLHVLEQSMLDSLEYLNPAREPAGAASD